LKVGDFQSAVLDYLDKDKDFVVELAQELVQIPTVNPKYTDKKELSLMKECQEKLSALLDDLGFELDVWEAPPGQPNIVARWRQSHQQGPGLIINGHIDVVPPGDLSAWSVDPWSANIQNGRIYGRGTYDMKGGLACAIAAAKALHQFGIVLRGDFQLHIVVDEEGGGSGTRSVLDKGYRADVALVAEPTSGQILLAEGGLEWVRITVRGRAAHAGWRYEFIYPHSADKGGYSSGVDKPGVSAVEKGQKILAAVLDLEKHWGRTKNHPLLPPGIATINPGAIIAGAGLGDDGLPEVTTNPAIVPDVCVIDLDLKYPPDASAENIKREFENHIHAVAQTDPWLKENPPTLEWGLNGVSFPPVLTPMDHPIVKVLSNAVANNGYKPSYGGFVAVCDAAFYAGKGIKTIIFGPEGAGAHAEDEYVTVDSLHRISKIVAQTILDWCGVGERSEVAE
jgi:acetylornithine deacetylase